tara:strand:- start:101363 stop:101521 length:159 start_codon:yes stop_codon:yes gene_type:complete
MERKKKAAVISKETGAPLCLALLLAIAFGPGDLQATSISPDRDASAWQFFLE